MNEEIIHLRIALLCSFPPKFMLARLHPVPPTPLAVDELAVDVFGQHKSLCSRGMTPTLQCYLFTHLSKACWLVGSACCSLGNIHRVGLSFWVFVCSKTFWASWLCWGVRPGVLDTSSGAAVIWGTVLSVCCIQDILSLVWGCRALPGKGDVLAEYWWQEEQNIAFIPHFIK